VNICEGERCFPMNDAAQMVRLKAALSDHFF
jgi:hypothetical protein